MPPNPSIQRTPEKVAADRRGVSVKCYRIPHSVLSPWLPASALASPTLPRAVNNPEHNYRPASRDYSLLVIKKGTMHRLREDTFD